MEPETGNMCLLLDPETDKVIQFLGPKTVIMCKEIYIQPHPEK